MGPNSGSSMDEGSDRFGAGFAGRNEVMQTILQGAQLANPELVDRAVFGLAILKAPQTPPGVP